MTRNQIYADAMPNNRVISGPNGTWIPQRRVSHTAGYNRGWRRDKEGTLFGADGYDAMRVLQIKSYRARRRAMRQFPHGDPWQSISEAGLTRNEAIIVAFGPKVAYQTNLVV